MQRENFEIRRGASYQREHEIKLSQISLAIAAGMYPFEDKEQNNLPIYSSFEVFVLCHTVKWIPNTWELVTMITIGKVRSVK